MYSGMARAIPLHTSPAIAQALQNPPGTPRHQVHSEDKGKRPSRRFGRRTSADRLKLYEDNTRSRGTGRSNWVWIRCRDHRRIPAPQRITPYPGTPPIVHTIGSTGTTAPRPRHTGSSRRVRCRRTSANAQQRSIGELTRPSRNPDLHPATSRPSLTSAQQGQSTQSHSDPQRNPSITHAVHPD